MARALAEQSHAFSIFALKKFGALDYNYHKGTFGWTNVDGSKSSVGYTVSKNYFVENDSIQLNYSQTDYWSGERKDFDYKIWLTSTRCYFGGRRYWFICRDCGDRVGVLYQVGSYFVCRHCGKIAYWLQSMSKRERYCFVSSPQLIAAEDEVKREYYDGKITRKYRKLIKLRQKDSGYCLREAELMGLDVSKLRKELEK